MGARGRVNLVLFGLAVVLGLLILLLPDPRRDHPPPAIDFEPAVIERIVYRSADSDETLELRRQADGWSFAAPVTRAARDGRVAQLLESLRERTPSCYPATEHDPAEFGLDAPRARLELDDIEVAFGDRANDGRRYLHAQGRICLVTDVALPILRDGVNALAPADDEGGD